MSVSRGQSEVLSSILVVAVVVLTVGIFGVHAVNQLDRDRGPTTEIDATITSSELSLTHLSGDSVTITDLTVILRYDGVEKRYNITSTNVSGDNDDQFEPGETWKRDPPYRSGDHVTVYLVHNPSGSVLFRETRVAVTPTPTPTPAPTTETGSGGGGSGGGSGGVGGGVAVAGIEVNSVSTSQSSVAGAT